MESSDNNHLDFVITKASMGDDGIKRWSATVSKFAVDRQDDEVTKSFFENSMAQIEAGNHPMPALVVSHYDDPRNVELSEGVPDVFKAGETTELYIDGDKPKAKGIFVDTPLGDATFTAVKADLNDGLPHEERVRISMAWKPEEGGVVKSEVDGHRIHNKGIIRHFAATRVPIVASTNLEVTYMSKSNAVTHISKFQDATNIVGEDLATELDNHYAELALDKAGLDELYEKADDAPKGKVAAGFDVGKCLTKKLAEGKDRKEALGACLAIGREAKKKSEAIVEKQRRVGKRDKAVDDCIDKMVTRGFPRAAATETCVSKAKKRRRQEITRRITRSEATGEYFMVEKIDLSMPFSECVSTYVNDHDMSEEEAKKFCNSAEAKTARAGDEEVEKAITSFDDVVDIIISDEDVSVVKSEDPVSSDDILDQVLEELAKSYGDAVETDESVVEVIEPAVNTPSGESQVAVIETPEKSEITELVESDELIAIQENFIRMKSAIVNEQLDRTEKTFLVKHLLDEMREGVEAYVEAVTPVSPQDTATMIKAALEEVMAPQAAQVAFLIEEVNTLREEKSQANGTRPVPKQLQPTNVEKASVNKPGALTAREMANASVRQDRPLY